MVHQYKKFMILLKTGRVFQDIESKELKEKLSLNSNKEVKEIIETIYSIGETTDEGIFDIMERKFKVSQNIISVIKEASLDCIQHTRDEPELNDKCIRFSNLLKNEIAYFPGISSEDLQMIDVKTVSGYVPRIYDT